MKKILLKISLFLPILFSVVFMNYFVDPANLFRGTPYEQSIAKLLLQGQNVANISNYDERLLQKFYIQGLTQKKDIIVLGSSRSMQISTDMFPGKTLFNNSVSGASVEDFISIYEMYSQKNLQPSIVIIGLDPWLLNRNNGQTRWKSLISEYQAGIKRLGFPLEMADYFRLNNIIPDKYFELISLSYFQESVRYGVKFFLDINVQGEQAQFYSTNETSADVPIKLSDGSYSYAKSFSSLSTSEVRKLAISYVGDTVYSLESFNELDNNLALKLESFIGFLQNNGVDVILFLPPYHPATYELLISSDKYKIIVEAQQYFSSLAKSRHIVILGSYNPYDVICDESEFYDGMHTKKSCIEKIFADYSDK